MLRDLTQFETQVYDLLVVGGGINGASIANLASKRGYKVALVEKGDFASGTSSKSSKLMHGGLRYLENFQFSLVSEALRERTFHVRNVSHLVKPLEFVVPVYKNDKRPLWLFHLGVFLYDLLAGKHRIGKHRKLSRKQLIELEPQLKKEGLQGGVSYYDAQMDDTRLCLENILCAAKQKATVANYAEVISFIKENGRVVGAQIKDVLSSDKKLYSLRAKHIVVASGAWTDEVLKKSEAAEFMPRVRPTKGVHIVTERKLFNHAMLIPSKQDRRIFFVLPWREQTMIGTTDNDYFAKPDQLQVMEEDVEYLIDETNRVYEGDPLKFNDVQASFAGLRPLVAQHGSESKASREHLIFQTTSGLFSIVGGKYTTYRVIAKECVDQILGMQDSKIDELFSHPLSNDEICSLSKKFEVEEETARDLASRYGSKTVEVLKMGLKRPELLKKISNAGPYIHAEIAYACDVEMARTPEDIVMRRLSIAYSPRDLLTYGPLLHQISERYLGSNSL
jgi:glycerol-3-phosphate dehydrogenase